MSAVWPAGETHQGSSLLRRLPVLGDWGTATRGIRAGAICSAPTASCWLSALLGRNLFRFVGSMANQGSTVQAMFPTACTIMEVYFPLMAGEADSLRHTWPCKISQMSFCTASWPRNQINLRNEDSFVTPKWQSKYKQVFYSRRQTNPPF